MVGKNGFGVSYLKKQMGNARFLISHSSSDFEHYRLMCKIMGVEKDDWFEGKKFTMMVMSFGNKGWHLGLKLHRVDGPAIEFLGGTKIWFFEGKKHRIGGPAVEYPDGTKEWWVEGKHIIPK